MTFVTPWLLAGVGLAALPVVLHLIMRQQPRKLEFPALRFIRQMEQTNRRRLQLRHWLLLALRVGAVCFLAMALARPSVNTSSSGAIGNQEAPVAAAMIFDTLPRMEYRRDNLSRLQAAQEICIWLLPQLPAASEVAVLDARPGVPVFQVDLGAARQRVERLETSPVGQPLPAVLERSIELLKTSEHERKEIYLFTDLAQAAWPADQMSALQERLLAEPNLVLYLIDVGAIKPQNFSLGEVRLSGQVLPSNSALRIETELSSLNTDGERVVELSLRNAAGQWEKRNEDTIQVTADAPQTVEFTLEGLNLGTHQGRLRMVGADGLAADDERYFTVEFKPPWKVLIAGSEKPSDFSRALSGEDARSGARFACDVVAQDKLDGLSLGSYAAVCLLDPEPLPQAVWEELARYAESGRSMAIFLGRNADLAAFNQTAPQALLPGMLAATKDVSGDLFLAPLGYEHPLLAKFRPLKGTVPWEDFAIYHYWPFVSLQAGVGQIMSFGDGAPALLERPLGKGRVITMTVPISERAETSTKERWSDLSTGFEPWPFVMLSHELMLYLVGSAEGQLNYMAGQPAVLRLEPEQQFPTYLVTNPAAESVRQAADAQQTSIIITDTNKPGNYQVEAGGEKARFDRGFSMNLSPSASDLKRLEPEQLDELFGDVEYRLARNRDEIDRAVSKARVGRELFPILIGLVAIVLGLEQVLANRFYKEA